MMLFPKCPVCGGEVVEKDVEEVLRGGANTAIVRAHAEVCLHCGERLYPVETIRRFESIRDRLARQDTSGMTPVGRSFQVA
jgi:YgiT-type zinc finger domain-containing protein